MAYSSLRLRCGARANHLIASLVTSRPYCKTSVAILNGGRLFEDSFINSRRRFLSSASATTEGNTAASNNAKDQTKKDTRNIFLDNLGTIFLLAIAGVVLTIVRSSYGSTNKHNLRDQMEADAALDPLEIDDLRVANSELTPDVFRMIMSKLMQDFPHGEAKYVDLVYSTRAVMKSHKGEPFTVEMGHLIDRAVETALEKQGKKNNDQVSIVFFLTALSLALDIDTSVSDRIRALYNVLELHESEVKVKDVIEMIGFLQDTSQLTPDAQVIMAQDKYPVQQYKVATPEEMVAWDGSPNETIDIQAFADILRSKSVCAWGECYFKKKTQM